MNPFDLKNGMKVMYHPSPDLSFIGTVDGVPWQLGSGVLVVRLKGMPQGYAKATGKNSARTWVNAAAVDRLEAVGC